MARPAPNAAGVESPFQNVPSTPRVYRRTTESPTGIVPDLVLLQQHSDTIATPGRYQNVPGTHRILRTPHIDFRPQYHLIATVRLSSTPVVIKSPQSDQVVPVQNLQLQRKQNTERKKQHDKSPPQQLQQVAVKNPDADFWDVFSGDSIFG